MIPYDVDPTLHSNEPEAKLLDDGFSPPPPEAHDRVPAPSDADAHLGIGEKSLF